MKHKDQWYKFNDRFVRKYDTEELLENESSTPYILFYQ